VELPTGSLEQLEQTLPRQNVVFRPTTTMSRRPYAAEARPPGGQFFAGRHADIFACDLNMMGILSHVMCPIHGGRDRR
jgi:hypothetical protein